ncbi:hypothetical protein KGQ90_16410 [Modicisalibacter tunisiensis]|uniref:hypothetical protein n=1 Tax=Modicisalibacter tunisiensis TaxID=390637 RepID=UPI001CD0283D|nr:hypothetical protein [Modicisalibacter tunisiensis]MBZ9540503.1 hypothetical protein [Modicisalibacter tunisiensis]
MMTPAEVRHLEAERQRLERRKTWAAYRLDPHALERASISPRGRENRAARRRPGYFNAVKWRRRL